MEGQGHYSLNLSPEMTKQVIERLFRDDNKELFVYFVNNHLEKSNGISSTFQQSDLLKLVCTHCAVGCATALLEGETGLTVDVNVTWEDGLSPLHLAAQNLSYGLTQLLLHHGSNPNPTNYNYSNNNKDLSALPLSMALNALRDHPYVADWGPGKSVYKLIYILSLQELKEPLNTIKLLLQKTGDIDVEEISYYFIKQEEVAQFAALLMIAWDKLVAPFIAKGVEGSAIGEHLWRQIETVNNRELEVMISCRPSCECLPVLKNKKTKLIAQWKLLKILDKGRDAIEQYHYYSSWVEDRRKYDVPYSVACNLSEAGFVLHPDDVYCDDIKCLRPKLDKEDKERLNKDIEEKLRSASILGRATLDCVLRYHWKDVDIREYSHFKRVCHALGQDNKDEFVKLINSWTSMEEFPDYGLSAILEMFYLDSVDCAAAVLRGETDGMLNLTTELSIVGTNALILAAKNCAPRITELLLSTEFVADAPNLEGANLKYKALTIALSNTRDLFRASNANRRNTAVKHVTILCGVRLRRALETVRLLAYDTKEIKHAFVNYLKQGQMVEVGALLLVATELVLSSPISQEEGSISFENIAEMRHFLLANRPSSSDDLTNEVMELQGQLTLLDIFDKIGDKLAAYVQLDVRPLLSENWSPYPAELEVPSLLEEASFHVKAEDINAHSVNSLGTLPFCSTVLQRPPIGECDNKFHDAHMLPKWWMRSRAIPSLDGKSDDCSRFARRLFSTTPSNRKSACLAPTKRLADGVQSWRSQNQFALVMVALRKGLRHV